MKGRGASGGAVTVVNGIATGRGAAIGIDLGTRCEVELVPEDAAVTLEAVVQGVREPAVDPVLLRECIAACWRGLGDRVALRPEWGARVATRSSIPVGRGLKSSSAAANAMVSAVLDALGVAERVALVDVARWAADASQRAGVSITGAFDDGCACLLGGLVLTDNTERVLLSRRELPRFDVTLVVPHQRRFTAEVGQVGVEGIAPRIDEAFRLASEGDWASAMRLNSEVYSRAYGLPHRLVEVALGAGAVAAGLSGKGPAVAALSRPGDGAPREAVRAAAGDAAIVETRVRNHRAAWEVAA